MRKNKAEDRHQAWRDGTNIRANAQARRDGADVRDATLEGSNKWRGKQMASG